MVAGTVKIINPPAPPIPPIAWFDVIVVLVRVSDPAALKIPPPRPMTPLLPPKEPFAPAATLFVTASELSVNRPPLLRIPPPSPAARPPSIVTPVIDTVPP